MTEGHARPARRRWWPWAGAGIGIGLAALVLWRIDFAELGRVLAGARVEYLALVPAVIALEQLVRAWKWRQILHPLLPVGTLRLFGAIMAGYLGNFLIPFGVSPLLRSWLVARREGLKMSAVLATVAIDRMIDGVVFAILVVLVLAVAVLPDPTGNLRLGLLGRRGRWFYVVRGAAVAAGAAQARLDRHRGLGAVGAVAPLPEAGPGIATVAGLLRGRHRVAGECMAARGHLCFPAC